MPLKRATNRKTSLKAAADSEVYNNGETVESEKLSNETKNFPNGSSCSGTDDVKELLKVTKRSSGRNKNAVADLVVEAPTKKKPAAKGRGKKKLNENKVIENEADIAQVENQEVEIKANEKHKTKPKGRGGGKKVEIKTEKIAKANEIKQESPSTGCETDGNELTEKDTKLTSSRRKKQDVVLSKSVEPMELSQENEEEKASKNYSRNSKKSEKTEVEIEPQKKKRTSKKEKFVEREDDKVEIADEIKADIKEKKPPKRGRAIDKAVKATKEILDTNGDAEEGLPKKRSRNAPSVEKEITKKSKKARAKKSDKEENAEVQETEDKTAANGERKEKTEDIEESPRSKKKAKEVAAPAPKESAKAKGRRKRAAPSTSNKKQSTSTADNGGKLEDGLDNTELVDEVDGSKPSKTKRGKTDATLVNSTSTIYNKTDFDLPPLTDGKAVEEPRFNFKISSWNVAGLRSWLKKDGLKFLNYEQPDIFCMQETKCTNDQLPEEVVRIPGYHPYWLCMPGGYAGVAIYSKIMPINVEYGIGNKEFDDSGRIITAEYEKFFLINVYVPNSGRKLVNLETRMQWEKLFQEFVKNLDERKPVVICGDMNVSHQEHDLANPKANTRNAGFTKEERDKMTELLALGYIDTFRHLYPERKGVYTFWTYMGNARSRNVGWRLDYFIVSERFIKRVVDNCTRSQCMGSDHCPITLFLKL